MCFDEPLNVALPRCKYDCTDGFYEELRIEGLEYREPEFHHYIPPDPGLLETVKRLSSQRSKLFELGVFQLARPPPK